MASEFASMRARASWCVRARHLHTPECAHARQCARVCVCVWGGRPLELGDSHNLRIRKRLACDGHQVRVAQLGARAPFSRRNDLQLAPFSMDGVNGGALSSVQAHSVVNFYAGQIGVKVGVRAFGQLHQTIGDTEPRRAPHPYNNL